MFASDFSVQQNANFGRELKGEAEDQPMDAAEYVAAEETGEEKEVGVGIP